MWYDKAGKDTDVILASKVVISRNIKGFPFPVKMNAADRENVIELVKSAGAKQKMNFIRCDEMNGPAKEDMYKNYFSEARFLNESTETGFLISNEEGVTVVVNNRNHIEIESIEPGSDVVKAYKKADKIASNFEKDIDTAYTESMGFLSSDIGTVGLGVQIINMVAIPGIEKTVGAIAILNKRLALNDWQVVSMGSMKGTGMYVLTNTATLGIDEKELIDRATNAIKDVITFERICRENIVKKKSGIVEDQFFRSYALLKYARRMEIAEAMEHLNWLRVGKNYIKNEIPDVSFEKINKMTHMIRRNYKEAVTKNSKTAMFAQARAAGIRSILEEES